MLQATLRQYAPLGEPRVLLACSGGRDSQVLMHAAAAAWPKASLAVGHVHHGLQAGADDWLDFCRRSAEDAGLAFHSRRLPPASSIGGAGGIEAWARRHRYRALAEIAAEVGATIVITAHHANDQIETVQLRRLRGAGPIGLGAMRVGSPLPGERDLLLLRPFLRLSRQQLGDYAEFHQLRWIEDPSNQDPRYARNRVRRSVDETLARNPEALADGLASIDAIQREADAIQAQAARDLEQCRLVLAAAPSNWGDPSAAATADPDGGQHASLSRAALARLPPARIAEALRHWLGGLGCRMPSRAKLAEISRQLLDADSTRAEIFHDGRWVVRYRDRIDSAASLPEPLTPTWFHWGGEALLDVAGHRFIFTVHDGGGLQPGIDPDWLAGVDLLLDRGRGLDRLRYGTSPGRRSWKNLSQQQGVPPWLRPALPVLRAGVEVLYAAPFGMPKGARNASSGTSRRVVIDWSVPEEWRRWL